MQLKLVYAELCRSEAEECNACARREVDSESRVSAETSPMSTPTGQEPTQHGAMRETVLLAGAAAASFLLGLARTKVQALAFGPIGMGAIGLMQSSMSTATLVTGLGVDAVVTRELARTSTAAPEQARSVRDAALRGMSVVGAVGAVGALGAFFLLRNQLGFGSIAEMAIVAVGTLLGVMGANLRAVLAGLRQVRELGISSIVAAAVAAALVGALYWAPRTAVVWSLVAIAVPVAQVLVLALALNRHAASGTPDTWGKSVQGALRLARQSSVLAVAGVLPVLSQLLMRTVAHEGLSDVGFGYFQAAMALAAISVSVLASSVGPSVLPRLSAASADPANLSGVISEQVGVYLLLYVPIVLAVESMPELVIRLVYSEAFLPVADQLRWQLVGEVLRLPCWVMATALTARGLYRHYLLLEAISLVVSVAAVALSVKTGALSYVGLALSGAVFVQFVVLTGLLWRADVRLPTAMLLRVVGAAGLCAAGAALTRLSFWASMIVLMVAVALGVVAMLRVLSSRSGRGEVS